MLKNVINFLKNIFFCKHHGNHVFVDFIWNINSENIDHVELANTIFQIMENSILRTNMKIVHKKLCILDIDTPPGFTSILLLDESHYSAHCYSDRGWLAMDIFTCGKTDPEPIMNYSETEIKKRYPSMKCTLRKKSKRFNYI
jgi:S-adenosylmethionine decarboxylase